MTDRPITFTAPEVRAVLDGRKTQTRQIIKPCPWPDEFEPPYIDPYPDGAMAVWYDSDDCSVHKAAPFVVGDRLWVRETWTQDGCVEGLAAYKTDGHDFPSWVEGGKWRSPVTMPRWASRITLTVKSVRVERLQDISEADAIAEGSPRLIYGGDGKFHEHSGGSVRVGFTGYWVHRHGPASWDANPWVVAVEFERIV